MFPRSSSLGLLNPEVVRVWLIDHDEKVGRPLSIFFFLAWLWSLFSRVSLFLSLGFRFKNNPKQCCQQGWWPTCLVSISFYCDSNVLEVFTSVVWIAIVRNRVRIACVCVRSRFISLHLPASISSFISFLNLSACVCVCKSSLPTFVPVCRMMKCWRWQTSKETALNQASNCVKIIDEMGVLPSRHETGLGQATISHPIHLFVFFNLFLKTRLIANYFVIWLSIYFYYNDVF